MKKLKKVKLRYLLPLIVLVVSLIGLLMGSMGTDIGKFCTSGIFQLCFGIGVVVAFILNLPGYFLGGLLIDPLEIMFGQINTIVSIGFKVLVSLFCYYGIGYGVEKVFLKRK